MVGWLSAQTTLVQMNRLIQDFVIAMQGHALQDKVVIVAIDDTSIATLGRWPWRRALHAELLHRLHADQAKVVGLDILFTEPDKRYPIDDATLAAAIKQNSPVVLPLLVQSQNGFAIATQPLKDYAEAATAIGHVQLKVDSDGIVRSVSLQEQVDNISQPNFALSLLNAGGETIEQGSAINANTSGNLQHQAPTLIPYAGGAGYFPRISYLDVLQGNVPKGTFSGKYVIVGATAAGIGDQYATPTTNKDQLMPGVEILANITDALLRNTPLNSATALQNIGLNVCFVILALIGFALLEPLRALLLTVVLGILLVATTYLAGNAIGILFAPSAGILGLVFVYPLWSWHRLDAATRFLTDEYNALQNDTDSFYARTAQLGAKDFLDKRIAALDGATRQLRNLHRFISDSVNALPDATLICGVDGKVRIANSAAHRHFASLNLPDLVACDLHMLVKDVLSTENHLPIITQDMLYMPSHIEGEGRDGRGRDLLVKCVPCFNAEEQHIGWILSLVDVTQLWQAERDRDEAFRFITHDIRSPISSIISLLELQRLDKNEPASKSILVDHLLDKIEQQATNALDLTESFVTLSRAKSSQYQLVQLDLVDLLNEVVDDAWAQAKIRAITIKIIAFPEDAWVMADREMMKRSLINVLGNAIKFSPDSALVTCSISSVFRQANHEFWDIAITDEGLGIPLEKQDDLFQPFKRLHNTSHPEITGTGLGLAFAYAVVQRHGGEITVSNGATAGATFHIVLPRLMDLNI
ncbi:histidine kinase [Methyloradius palustris]|uniref:histidine kinase n=2 Tax=Methyloradius palustris TaxID=2778876 RepID=A0A8D5GCY1_9PROT|nr:histidine kinase [Methyloradius palustris]